MDILTQLRRLAEGGSIFNAAKQADDEAEKRISAGLDAADSEWHSMPGISGAAKKRSKEPRKQTAPGTQKSTPKPATKSSKNESVEEDSKSTDKKDSKPLTTKRIQKPEAKKQQPKKKYRKTHTKEASPKDVDDDVEKEDEEATNSRGYSIEPSHPATVMDNVAYLGVDDGIDTTKLWEGIRNFQKQYYSL